MIKKGGAAPKFALTDGKGKIEEIWNKVKVKNHVDEVLKAVKG